MTRYVLKNKDTGDVLFVVVFTLLSKEKVDEDKVKEAESVQQGKPKEKEQEKIEDPDDSVD